MSKLSSMKDPPTPLQDLSIPPRSEEHTSELQSQSNLVCRLLHEKNIREQPLGDFHRGTGYPDSADHLPRQADIALGSSPPHKEPFRKVSQNAWAGYDLEQREGTT